VVKIFPEWVMGPEQGKSSGRIATLTSKLACLRMAFPGIFNNMFRPQKNLKKTKIKLYNTLALPVLLYGSETWTIKARDARRISAAEIKYMKRTAEYTWTDYKTDTQIAKELQITQILDKLLEYKRNWIQHVNRIPHNRLPRVMKHYSPTGERNQGRKYFWTRETRTGQQVAQLHDKYDDDDDDDDDDVQRFLIILLSAVYD
jgi:hypothetical protein